MLDKLTEASCYLHLHYLVIVVLEKSFTGMLGQSLEELFCVLPLEVSWASLTVSSSLFPMSPSFWQLIQLGLLSCSS